MKRVWICALLLLSLLGAALWSSMKLSSLIREMTADLQLAQRSAEEGAWEQAAELTQRAGSRWEAQRGYLYVVLRHSEANEVQSGLREAEQLLRLEDPGEYAAANARLIAQLQSLAETEHLTVENLF